MKLQNVWDLNKARELGTRSLFPRTPKVSISMSTCGHALGSDIILQALEKEKEGAKILLGQTGCSGFCDLEPMAILRLPGMPALLYTHVDSERAKELIRSARRRKFPKKGLLCKLEAQSPSSKIPREYEKVPSYEEVSPFKCQSRIVLENCGIVDPLSVQEYIARGGYYPLYKALYHMSPEEVLDEVSAAGVRGRGRAWFSTAMKWSLARKAEGEEKFLVCNADEGDPGAYKDRTVMEGNPFKLFEGMALAGYVIGAHQGLIYLREEYPYTFRFLTRAIEVAKRYGVLGRHVLGSEFNFSIKIIRGGGAYVCGEETALLDSLEGEIGDPRLRPPFPIESGLWERPTIVNNVETLSNVPSIIQHGAAWYANLGTEKAKGTKIFSVVGKIRRPGLYELPLGTSLKGLVYDLAGGPVEGGIIKAVQVGSPFGTFIRPEKLDLPLDPESLNGIGSMIGSGVIVVLDQNSCLVDILRHILSFFVEESCGKCVPCREGVFRMREIMEDIYEGRANLRKLGTLSDLGEMVSRFALCGLGGGAPVPILSGIRDFKRDFKAHITTGKCPWPQEVHKT